MHITFDYLAVGVILFAFMTLAVSVVLPGVYSPLVRIEEEQIQSVAERTLTKICSTTGSPENWGTAYVLQDNSIIVQNITGFGLARYSNGYAVPDDIDVDKLSRLVPTTSTGGTNPLYVPPAGIVDLLGLTWDTLHLRYGFLLTVKQALNTTATPSKYIPISQQYSVPYAFDVIVRNSDGLAAAGANVRATYLMFWMKGNDVNYSYVVKQGKTDWKGYLSIEYNTTQVIDTLSKGQKPSVMFIAYAEYYGIKSQTVAYDSSLDVLEATVNGDDLILEFPQNSSLPQGARHVRGAFGISYSNIVEFPIWKKGPEEPFVVNQGSKSYAVFNLGYVDRTLDTLGVYIIYLGKPTLVFARRPPAYLEYGYGTGLPSGMKIAFLRRMVRAGELSYWVELLMWRTAEI